MLFRKIFLAILLVFCLAGLNYAQTKRALIFAIGKYPEDSGWPEISSSRDEALVRKALTAQKFTDIASMADASATISGIKGALDALIERSKPGDIVVIHISSHGERLEDLSGNKPDGLEESIVSYEGKLPAYGSDPTPAEIIKLRKGYFRDDELGVYIDKLRAKLGPDGDVLLLLDLCYAGTGTRGTARVRGGRPPLVSPGFGTNQHTPTPDDKQTLRLPDERNMSPYVVIGAAAPNESDNEIKDDDGQATGPLSYAISKVFVGLDNKMTYRSLFARISSVMNEKQPGQHPVLVGNGQDRTLFGGKFIAQKPYLTVDHTNGHDLFLQAGKFAGLDSGAKVNVYPAGTADPASGHLMATGTVINAGLYNSMVRIDQNQTISNAASCWVFPANRVFKNKPVNIAISGKFTPNETERIHAALHRIAGVHTSGDPILSIVKGTTTNIDSILISSTGKLFDTLHYASRDTAALTAKIRTYIRYQFLRSVNISDADNQLTVKLLPVIDGKADTTFINKDIQAFRTGDKLMIWVSNTGPKALYINILDMQPNGLINPILPNRQQRIFADDLLVPSGSSYLFRNYIITIEPPFGTEVFKVFASTTRIDLEDITAAHGENKRGNLSPFEALLQGSFNLRGQPAQNLAKANGSTYNLYFDIVPSK